MSNFSRRQTFQLVAAAALGARAQAQPRGKMRLGVIADLAADAEAAIRRVHDLGFSTCQVVPRATDDAAAAKLRKALDQFHVEATSVIVTGPPPEVYDFYRGPSTIGFVPRQYRQARIARAKEVSDFARKAGLDGVQGHCGFIPEDPNDPLYKEAVEAIRTVAAHCKGNGQTFRCETGQETPVTLVRALRDAAGDNIGVNLDPANLIMYGKANPLDAVALLAPYIKGVHAKDGRYPADPSRLGEETPIGRGLVNFPVFIEKLKGAGYNGPLTIEREIRGEKQTADILAAKKYLETLIG